MKRQSEKTFDLDFCEASIKTFAGHRDSMLQNFRKGKEAGSKTYVRDMDHVSSGGMQNKMWSWKAGEFNLWTGYNNEGKALNIDELIPVPGGFKKMRDIQVGDSVFDENGLTCNVTNVTEIMYGHECFEVIFSDGTTILADKDHRWLVDDNQVRASKSRIAKKKGLIQKRGTSQVHLARQSEILTTGQMFDNMKKGLTYGIPLTKPVNYSEKNQTIDPYLLGIWLGDGNTNDGGITSADLEVVERIKSEGYKVTTRSGNYRYGVLGLKAELDKFGLIGNKHIPFDYLFGSVDQRIELLKGLMDSDGYTDSIGRCEFTSIKKDFALQVKTLISSLGIKCYFTEDDAKLNGKFISKRYRLRFKSEFHVFHLSRKKEKQDLSIKSKYRIIKSIKKTESVPVKCISVDSPNNLYLCTDSFIVTHNTQFLIFLCVLKAINEGWKFAFFSPENYPPDEFFDDIIHTILGKSTDRAYKNFDVQEDEYLRAFDMVKDNFYFVYPEKDKVPDFRIEQIESVFEYLVWEKDVKAVIVDPYIKIRHEMSPGEPEHLYASRFMMDRINFTRKNNVSYHLVMHQTTPRKEKDGNYPPPSLYQIKGGGTFADSTDNSISVWRPNRATDPNDTTVIIKTDKIKKQKLVGIPTEITIDFNRKRNRYTGKDGFDYFENALIGKAPAPRIEKFSTTGIDDFIFPDQSQEIPAPF